MTTRLEVIELLATENEEALVIQAIDALIKDKQLDPQDLPDDFPDEVIDCFALLKEQRNSLPSCQEAQELGIPQDMLRMKMLSDSKVKREKFYSMWSDQYDQELIDILLELLASTLGLDLNGTEIPGRLIDDFHQTKISRNTLFSHLESLNLDRNQIQMSLIAIAKDEPSLDPNADGYLVKEVAEVIRLLRAVSFANQGGGSLDTVTNNAIEIAAQTGVTFGENALIELAEIIVADAVQMAAELNNLRIETLGHLLGKGQYDLLSTLRNGTLNTQYHLDGKKILQNKGLMNGIDYSAPLASIGDSIIKRVEQKQSDRNQKNQEEQEKVRRAYKRLRQSRGI